MFKSQLNFYKLLILFFLIFFSCSSAEKKLPEFTPGLYDCTATGELKERKSPIPLNCVIDPACAGERMVVAHRGAGGEFGVIAPEDSLSAIRAALWLGVDGIELDVRHTADGKLIVMHDGNMKRTTGIDADVSTLTFAEVTSTRLLAPPDRYTGDFSCDRVPSLEDALALAKDRVFVDLDTKTDRIDLVVNAIVNAGMIDQVFVSVSDVNKAIEARNLNPAIRIQIRPDTVEDAKNFIAIFQRMPEIIEIPWKIGLDVRSLIGPEAKLFSDVFTEDVITVSKKMSNEYDLTHYLNVFDNKIDIVQTEFPTVLLQSLDRWEYSTDPWNFVPDFYQ